MDKVKSSPLCLPFSRLSVVDTLGKGSFGSVQLVKEKTKGGIAALKTIPKEHVSNYMIENDKQNTNNTEDKKLGTQALKEISAMKKVCTGKCSGIPRYVGDREDKDNYYILMDSVKGKSLRTIVNEIGPFTDINTIRSILAQILSTISFIHSHNILHRDLSDNNILIQPNGIIKIIDFGCATVFDPSYKPECTPYTEYPEIDPDDINKKNIIGTLDFLAPEVLVDGYFSEKSDIWSFGVLLFYMVTGHYPFTDDEIDDVYETMFNILEYTIIFYENDYMYEPLCDLFYLCCNPDINSRATIEELKKHVFFSEIDWDTITLPKNKRKPNLSVHTSVLRNNANGMMGPNQIYIASPTCLNSPLRINSPSCLYTPTTYGFNGTPLDKTAESPIITTSSPIVNSPLAKASSPAIVSPIRKSPLVKTSVPVIAASPKVKTTPVINSTALNNNCKNPHQENVIFSPKSSKYFYPNSNNVNSITSPRTMASPTITNINYSQNPINKKNLKININNNFYNDEYVSSPLTRATPIYSPIKETTLAVPKLDMNLNGGIHKSVYPKSPLALKASTVDYVIDDEKNTKAMNETTTTPTSVNKRKNNEYISEILYNNNSLNIEINKLESSLKPTLSPANIKYSTQSSEFSEKDDDAKSNSTLVDDTEKDCNENESSSLIEDNTLILNNAVNTNDVNVYESNDQKLYKTWESEHSHILTF